MIEIKKTINETITREITKDIEVYPPLTVLKSTKLNPILDCNPGGYVLVINVVMYNDGTPLYDVIIYDTNEGIWDYSDTRIPPNCQEVSLLKLKERLKEKFIQEYSL